MSDASKTVGTTFEDDLTRVLEIKQAHAQSASLSTQLGIADPAWRHNKLREHRGFLLSFIDKLWAEYSRTLQQHDDRVEQIEALQLELKAVQEQYTNYHDWAQEEVARLRRELDAAKRECLERFHQARHFAELSSGRGSGEPCARQNWECPKCSTMNSGERRLCVHCDHDTGVAQPPEVDVIRDAARYRWIRKRENADIAACWLLPGGIRCDEGPESFDAAVDEAMRLGKHG